MSAQLLAEELERVLARAEAGLGANVPLDTCRAIIQALRAQGEPVATPTFKAIVWECARRAEDAANNGADPRAIGNFVKALSAEPTAPPTERAK